LQNLIHREKYTPIRDRVLINITGCPNSCSPYRIADIGLRGARILEKVGSVEGYQISVGGTQRIFGQIAGQFKVSDCLNIIETILDTFLNHVSKNPDQKDTLADHVQRVGIEHYSQAIAALGIKYDMAKNPREHSTFTGQGKKKLDRKTIARDVPCQNACPAKTNVPEYIRQIALGNPDQAHRINQEDNVLPGVLGRICTRPCEDQCRHQWTNTLGPVRICHLKRSAGDTKQAPSEPLPPYYGPSSKKVAVIGGGPAGLAAARELKRYGHDVTLLERAPYLGGQVRSGVPRFRLPREVLADDINAIINSGIEVKLNTNVDGPNLMEILDSHDAVLLTAGANKPRSLQLEGLADGMGIEGLNFMKYYNDDIPIAIKGNVIIIGGGFTAVDCARSARRLLPPDTDVSIMYRRGEAQMAALEDELHELRRENIHIETLVTPVRARVEKGLLQAVTFCRNILGEPEADGRPSFIPVDQSEFEVPCDTLIFAIGQTQEMEIIPDDITLTGGHLTSHEKLFVAGDFATGNGDVIHAIADAKDTADEIDTWLSGQKRLKTYLHIDSAEETGRLRDYDLLDPPALPHLPLSNRDDKSEVELGYSSPDTHTHALRCYLCNYKFEIDQDLCIHCDWCIRVAPRDCILRLSHLEMDDDGAPVGFTEVPADQADKATYIWINSDNCIRCGNCFHICPVEAISLRKTDLEKQKCP
jgi:NADPH-dependent glutamate synthase beta subunit-like oxidoreductase/ferredoxin